MFHENTGYSVVDVKNGNLSLYQFNSTAHLTEYENRTGEHLKMARSDHGLF